jgi:SnoaL-like domain
MHPAVVYEIPQSRERIRGRDRYLRFNQEYPGDWHLRPKVVIADEQHGVAWFEWHLDDRIDDGMAFFTFADGLITQVTDFWPEPYEPPPGREHLTERW